MVALVIPGDFAAKVQAGKPVKIQIIGDGSDANTSRLAMGYAANIGTIYALAGYFGTDAAQRTRRAEAADRINPALLVQPRTCAARTCSSPASSPWS